MGKPAARVGDVHTCPLCSPNPHVGGPVLPPGKPTVLIGGMPAATVLNMCTCAGPPDMIVQGSATVFINGMPAARMGDMTAHGGRIISGCMTVLIGDAGGGSSGTAFVSLTERGSSVTPPTSNQATTLSRAAGNGTPFCEVC